MTPPNDLDAIEALLAGVTRGPWIAEGGTVWGPDGDAVADCYGNLGMDDGYAAADVAAFIAATRTLVPSLVAEVRELRARIDLGRAVYSRRQRAARVGLPEDADWPTIVEAAEARAYERAAARLVEGGGRQWRTVDAADTIRALWKTPLFPAHREPR